MDTVLFHRSTKNGSTHQLISVHTERLCMRLHQQHLVAPYLLTTVRMAVNEIRNKCAHINYCTVNHTVNYLRECIFFSVINIHYVNINFI